MYLKLIVKINTDTKKKELLILFDFYIKYAYSLNQCLNQDHVEEPLTSHLFTMFCLKIKCQYYHICLKNLSLSDKVILYLISNFL